MLDQPELHLHASPSPQDLTLRLTGKQCGGRPRLVRTTDSEGVEVTLPYATRGQVAATAERAVDRSWESTPSGATGALLTV